MFRNRGPPNWEQFGLQPRKNGAVQPRKNGAAQPRKNGAVQPRKNGAVQPRKNGAVQPRKTNLLGGPGGKRSRAAASSPPRVVPPH